MSRSNSEPPGRLSAEIRRQIGKAANTRYLRSLPLFRVEQELPEPFAELLREVDSAERRERSLGKSRRRRRGPHRA